MEQILKEYLSSTDFDGREQDSHREFLLAKWDYCDMDLVNLFLLSTRIHLTQAEYANFAEWMESWSKTKETGRRNTPPQEDFGQMVTAIIFFAPEKKNYITALSRRLYHQQSAFSGNADFSEETRRVVERVVAGKMQGKSDAQVYAFQAKKGCVGLFAEALEKYLNLDSTLCIFH